MPFTPAHVAAILPFTLGRPGRWLVPAALAIGAMVPDLPYVVPSQSGGGVVSHAWYGPITLDLIIGIGVWMAWELLLRVPMTDIAPRWLRLRLAAPSKLDPERCFAAGVSVVIGAATHVLWDLLTRTELLRLGSGLLGTIVLAGWFVLWLRRTPEGAEPLQTQAPQARRRLAWAVLAATVVIAPFVIWLTLDIPSPDETAFWVATRSTGVLGIVVALLCLVWPSPTPSPTLSPTESPAAGPTPDPAADRTDRP